MCLLHLLRDKLWFLSPRSHFLIGDDSFMAKCGNRLKLPQPCFLLASAGAALFLLEGNPMHTFQYLLPFQSFQFLFQSMAGFPPARPSLFTNCRGAPRHFPPSPSEDGGTFCWFTSCLKGKWTTYVWRLLALLANDPAVEGRRWAARFLNKVGPAKNLCRCCECATMTTIVVLFCS